MGAVITTTGNLLSYSWGNDNWRIPGSEIQSVQITPRNFQGVPVAADPAYWSVDVYVTTRPEPHIFDLRNEVQDDTGRVYSGWTNDKKGAQFAANAILAIAGIGGGGGGSGLVNDGDYGAITVSGGGTVWTINPGVVRASMIDSEAAANGDVLTADGAGGASWQPGSPGMGITDLTGDVTASGPGSAAAVIANNAVTNAKAADMAAGRIKMRLTGSGTGDPIDATANQLATTLDTDMTDRYAHISEITPVLIGINGDVVAGPGAGVQAATIQPDAVTNSKLANMAAATIKGRALGAGTGDPQDLTPTQATDAMATAVNPFVRTSALSGVITSVSASAPLASSGGATPNITHQNSGAGAGTYVDVKTLSINATGHVTGVAVGGGSVTYSGALLPFATKTGQGTYDLQEVYGVTWQNASLPLNDLYSLTVAQTKFAKVFQWFTSPGFGEDNTWVMALRHYTAAWLEALLQGNSSTPLGTARIGSNNEIIAPPCNALINYHCIYDSGSYIGQGTEGALGGASNTDMWFDLSLWQGTDPDDRALLMPSTYGNDTALGYTQGTYISGFRLLGGMNWAGYDFSTEDVGLLTWDTGECSNIGTVYAEGFHGLGIKVVRGTPTTIHNISLFENGLGGLGLYGNDLSTININTISGDDNPALIRVREGYGRPGGGTLNVNMVKSESGKRDPSRGQIVLDAADSSDTTGYYARYNFNTVWYACDFSETDAIFVIRSFTGANARINVNSFSGYGFDTMLQDVTNGKRWPNPGSFDAFGFTWNASGGGVISSPVADGMTWTSSAMLGTERLGVFYPSGTFNYVALTPTYDYTQGSPSPPASVRSWAQIGCKSNVQGCGVFNVGETGQAYGEVYDQYGQWMVGEPVSWSVQPGGTGNGSINASSGVFTASASGTVIIGALFTDQFATCLVQVN